MPRPGNRYPTLVSFLDGDIFSGLLDRQRWQTVDFQIGVSASIIGDGITDGWTITDNFPSITVSPGSGLIDGFAVNTFAEQTFDLTPNSTAYAYILHRSGIIGSFSPRSDLESISYYDSISPVIQNFTVVMSGESVYLSWSQNNEPDFEKYIVYRSEDDVDYTILTTTTDANYTDTTAEEETLYYYKLSAFDLSGNNSSTTISITTPLSTTLPPDPANVSVVPSESAISVLWEAPQSISSAKIDHYLLTCVRLNSDNTPNEVTQIQQTTQNLYDRFDVSIVNGEKYSVTIQTVDTKDRISSGVTKTVIPKFSSAAPDPIEIAYEQESGTDDGVIISLSWQSGDSPYDTAESHRYRIYTTIDNGIESKSVDVPVGLTAEQISLITYDRENYSTIAEDTLVTFRITSISRDGFESFGNYVRFVTDHFSVPEKVKNIQSQFNADNNTILATWDLNGAETVHIVVLDKNLETFVTTTIADEYLGKAERYFLDTVEIGHRYEFNVYSCLSNQTVCSDYAVTRQTILQNETIDAIPLPAPPVSLSARIGDREITLTWESSISGAVVSYRLYRMSGEIVPIANLWTLLDTMESGVHIFTDYGLDNGSAYSYYLTSIDVYGRESLHLSTGYTNLDYVTATPTNQSVLSEPHDLALVLSGTSIHLTWFTTLEEFDSFTVYRSKNNLHSWEQIGTVQRSDTSGPYTFTDNSFSLIDGTIFYYTIDKTINDADIIVQSSSVGPSNSIFLGKIIVGSNSLSIDQSDVRHIKNLEAPLTEMTAANLLIHRHKELFPSDPDRIDLNSELFITDWETEDGKIFTTEEENIEGTLQIVKVNDRFPSVFYRIDNDNKQIVFSSPITSVDVTGAVIGDIPAISMRVFGISEVDGILPNSRFDNLHARQIQFGQISQEQMPTLNHNGRIFEELIPSNYLLERYSNHVFTVIEGNDDSRKNFGTGTTFYTVVSHDGEIETVLDFDNEDDGKTVSFNKPLTSINTKNNLLSSPNISSVNSDPGGFQSTKSSHFSFAFVDNTPIRWVKITTDSVNSPNPIIDLKKRLRFKLLLTEGSLYLTLGIREINTLGVVGQNGGTTGPIEWVGIRDLIQDANGNVAPIGILIESNPDWQDIDIDLPKEKVKSYVGGDNQLSSGFGVLEHIAFTINPDDPNATGPFDIYIDKIEQVNDVLVSGTSQGIQISDDFGSNWRVVKLTITPVHKFFVAENNSFLWAITTSEVLLSVDPTSWFTTDGLTGIENIRDIAEDNDGNMYVSTEKGVYFLDISLIRTLTSWQQTLPPTPFSTDCYALYFNAEKNEIWVSTEIGIFKTNDHGETWNDTLLNTNGLVAYKIRDIGTNGSNLIAVNRSQVLRKLSSDNEFIVIADIFEQHNVNDIWTFEYFDNRLYLSTSVGVLRNQLDTLNLPSPLDITFDRVFTDLHYKGQASIAFGLNVVTNGTTSVMFICEENRLTVVDENSSLSIRTKYSGSLPTFFANKTRMTIGYIYSAFNNVLIFREPREVSEQIYSAYLPYQKFNVQYGGWAQTNPLTDVFIFLNGNPQWLHFEYDAVQTQISMNTLKDSLAGIPTLTDFNSLTPNASNLLNETNTDLSAILLTDANGVPATDVSDSIVQLIGDLSLLKTYVNSTISATLSFPEVIMTGKTEGEPSSRGSIFETKEGITSDSADGIIINTQNGLVDFSINPDKYKFDKYDRLHITIFNAIFSGTGEFTHTEIEEQMEERNTGLSSSLGRAHYANLIKSGIFLERRHPYLFERYNVANIQSRFYLADTVNWYDTENSTVDFSDIIRTDESPEIRHVYDIHRFDDEYYDNMIWVGTDNGIVRMFFTAAGELTIDQIIIPSTQYKHVKYIYVNDDIFIVCQDDYGTSKILFTGDFGENWDTLDTTNLPNRIYNFGIMSGNRIAGTENGIFYSTLSSGWIRADLNISERVNAEDAQKAFVSKFFNISQTTFIIAEANLGFFVSSQGIEYSANGFIGNSVECINKILRYRNITWIGTDKGLYNDANSILSNNVVFGLQMISEDTVTSQSVSINDIVAGDNEIYCCGNNGKIYRFANTDDATKTNKWLNFKVPDFGTIHKILLFEGVSKTYMLVFYYNKIKVIDITSDEIWSES